MNFGSKFPERNAQRLLHQANIASDFTCVFWGVVIGTFFKNNKYIYQYELGFSYLSIMALELIIHIKQYLLAILEVQSPDEHLEARISQAQYGSCKATQSAQVIARSHR